MSQKSTWPPHVEQLVENVQHVLVLLKIHTGITGKGRGRRHQNVEVLNKSAIVLLVACWEAFVEDLASAAFDFLLQNTESPDGIPNRVRVTASAALLESKNPSDVWKLAGSGWRDVLLTHANDVKIEYVGSLNTPRPRQVNTLFERLIGLRSLSTSWKWKGMSSTKACEALDELVTLRGDIAHRVRSDRYVKKAEVTAAAGLIQRMAAISTNDVAKYLKETVGERPWGIVRYRSTR